MNEQSLKDSLAYILKRVDENPVMSEEELYSVLVRSKFFEQLGYEKPGVDVKPQYAIPGERKKPDYICRDNYQNVIFVIEAKRPSEKKLQDALGQLWHRYVLPLKARYGVLTNGRRLIIYQRIKRKPEITLNLNLAKVTQKGCEEVFRTLRKPEYDITLHSKLEEYFASVEKLSLKTDLAKENFFETFKLERSSAFGLLLSSLVNLFNWVYPRSKFLKGAYGFWQKSLAREPKKIPDSWEPFLGKKRDVFRFMFCLETAHALLARLILAKACEDLDFPGISVSNYTLQKVHQVRGQIPLIAYPIVLVKLMREMKGQLVSSIFEEDIFGWWSDAFQGFMEKSSSELLRNRVDKSLEDFSEAIAKVILMLYKYDFGEVAGDPLGDLYQQYFDKDTRKALGEFYTPVEVVNYILDAVGYENIRYKRLLDPACGSGTFIVEALKRYLTEAKRKAKQHGWAYVLRDLCNSPKIVGFDIHPFACLIARTRFMLELIPYFKKALEEEAPRIFYLQRIPVFRTDSLAIEMIPPEFQRQRQLAETEEDIAFPVALPMKIDSESSISVSIILPSWRKILSHSLPLYNLDEYFCTLQAMFDAIKAQLREKGKYVPEKALLGPFREYLRDKDFVLLANFFKPYADHILNEIKHVQSEFEDGRLVKSIEDTVLASILKNYLQYDFIVGNPPYVRAKILSKQFKKSLEEQYAYVYRGKADLYIYFIKRAIDLLRSNGTLGFITSNKFTQSKYGEGIRSFILNRCALEQFVDFGDSGVFLGVTNYPCIFILEKTKKGDGFKCARVMRPKDGLLKQIREHIAEERYANESVEIFNKKQSSLSSTSWLLMPEDEFLVYKKIQKATDTRLIEIANIHEGIHPTPKSVFYDDVTEEKKIKDYRLERETMKPCLIGADVRRWRILWKGNYLIYPHKKEKGKVVPIELDKYPNLKKYLEERKGELLNREYLLNAGQNWFELWNQRDPDWFENPKIVTPDTSNKNNFAYDEEKFYTRRTCYLIIPHTKEKTHHLYLLGLLNSRVLEFYFKHVSPFVSGKYYNYKKGYLSQLPIKLPAKNEEEKIADEAVKKVETILQHIAPERLIKALPESYLDEYLTKGIEFDEIKHSLSEDHDRLKPFLSGLPGKGYVVYPSEGEDSIWVDTKEKAQYLALALRNRKVKQNETVKILIPRDNSIVTEILERVKKTVQEIKATPIDQLEEEINELVYQLYGLNEHDEAIIEGFLKKF